MARVRPMAIYAGVAALAALVVVGAALVLRRAPATPAPTIEAASAEVALQVISTPPGAVVTIAGQRQALLTPNVYRVPRAPALAVRIELDGYRPREEQLTLASGEHERALRVELAPLVAPTGRLAARVDARHALFLVDGKPVGHDVDQVAIELQPGTHTLRIEAKGFAPLERPIEVRAHETLDANWTLTPERAPAHRGKPRPAAAKPSGDEVDTNWPPR
jgi:hypothetical protein